MKDDKHYSLTKSWIKRVGRADKFNVEIATVCSDHFNDDDFENYLFFSELSGDELRGKNITLKENSVPNTNRSTGERMENSTSTSTSTRKKPTARFSFKTVPYHIDSLIRENEATVGLYLTMVEEPDVKANTMVQEEGPYVKQELFKDESDLKQEIIVNSGVFCPTCHEHLSYDTYLNQHLNKCHSDTVLNGK